ncbi:MAG: sialate O-acetylesterase [Candidatus Methylacidiphilales bacterium]|nr:sialate O-acetylesterase [Candidatus Methylacidiphilales bacterium]
MKNHCQKGPALLVLVIGCLGPINLSAAVRLSALFTDHMVLQQGTTVPVWGTADPGENVKVSFAGQEKSATADASGRWRVELGSLTTSEEPRELAVSSDKSPAPLKVADVLVGEVWICSGQSNMERQLGPRSGQQPLVNWEQEAASAQYPGIRHFTVDRKPSDTPLPDTAGKWEVCSPQTVPQFTAVGYYFGRDLHKQLKRPIGLIHTSWGGTPAESWTRNEALAEKMPDVIEAQKKAVAGYAPALAQYQADEPRLLEEWKAAVEKAKAAGQPEPRKPAPPRDPLTTQNRPSCLYNGMIHPLIPFAIRGVIWYQGESNAGRAKAYQTLFPLMISDWRKQWGLGDFPFLFVQIAPFKNQNPEIREAQLLTWKKTPATAMVVTTDVGDANDIHPTRKEPVGARLALAARALVYGEKLEYSGPVFESARFENGQAVVTFSHAGGLASSDGPLRGFILAGADRRFFPASAEIKGSEVRVSSPDVPQPNAVRYGWANVPDVNLVNAAGLPASPFRSDVE